MPSSTHHALILTPLLAIMLPHLVCPPPIGRVADRCDVGDAPRLPDGSHRPTWTRPEWLPLTLPGKWEGMEGRQRVGRDTPVEILHGPLARYAKLRVAHAPGMPGAFSPPPGVSDPDMHHGTCVTHVLWCMPGSLTIGFLWSRWRGQRSRHSRRMRNPQIYVSGKRPMSPEPITGLILGLRRANERRRYCVTTSLIGWAQA